MRIGLITGEYPPMQGGVGDFTRELARALIALGHDVVVITSTEIPATVDDSPMRIEPVVSKWTQACWRAMAGTARRLDLDVLNIQYQPAAYAMRIGINFFPWWYGRQPNHVPVVTTFHDLLVPYLFPKAGPLRRKVVEFLARRSRAVIVTNAEDRLALQPLIPNLFSIPIGSNVDPALPADFDLRAERAKWGARDGDWLIAYFGFLSLSKGGLTLMQSIDRLTGEGLPARLVLIGGRTGASNPGSEAYAGEVDRAVEALGLRDRVQSTGYVDAAQVSRALAAADVVALPYADGASFRRGSLMAALAHGKAIVTTHPRVRPPELLDGENCMLVPANDAAALAAGIRRVLSEPGLRARLEAGARDLSRQFRWDRIAARTVDVYRGVMR